MGSFILLNSQKSLPAKIFGSISLSAAFWSLFYFLWQISPTIELADLFMRTCMIGVVLMPPMFYHFASVLLNRPKDKSFILANYILSLLIIAFIYTPYYAKEGTPFLSFQYWLLPGPLFHLSIVQFVSLVIYSQALLILKAKKSKGIIKKQYLYFILGTTVAYISGTLNFLCWYRIPLEPYLNIGVSFYAIFVGYGILKFRLMGIEVFLKQSFGYIVFLFISIIISFPVLYYLNYFIENQFIFIFTSILFFSILMPILLQIKIRTQLNLEQLLFKKRHDYRNALTDIGKAIATKIQMNELIKYIIKSFSESMDVDNLSILINQNNMYCPINNQKNNKLILKKDSALIEYLLTTHSALIKQELEDQKSNLSKEIINKLEQLKAEVIVPIYIKEELAALLIIGKRSYEYFYNQEDIQALETFSSQLAIALDNAKAYKEIEDLNATLEDKVKERSDQLIQVKKLASLGQLAAGIAHHINNKINPPIQAQTIIKENIDEILKQNNLSDSDAAKQINTALNIIKSDLNVVKTIVNDLLTSSRKAPSNVELEYLDFNELLKKTVRIIKTDCVDRVKIHEDYEQNLPPIKGDMTRLEDVFMNLLKNALEAISHKGDIWVKTWQDSKSVFASIQDNGTGIAQEDMEQIFDFFFTTKEIGSGTGLGLSVSYATVKEHQGDINVTSSPDEGTKFVIQLPKELIKEDTDNG